MDVEDLAYSSVFSRLIGFFLGTQKHSRNISSVHGFPGHTVTMFGNDDSNSNRNVTEVIDLMSKKKQLCTCSTLYGTLFAITAQLWHEKFLMQSLVQEEFHSKEVHSH